MASRENPPFRPAVSLRDCPEDLLELMEKCWSDNADERPTFETIRGTIRCIMKYVTVNFFLSLKDYGILI